MKKINTLLVLMALSASTFAQDNTTTKDTIPPNWTVKGGVGIMLNQVGLYNWQGGGVPSFAATLLYKGSFNYKKGKNSFENYIDLSYGLIQQGKSEITKSDDRWEVGSKFGHQINDKWDINVFGTLRSQFAEGFDPDHLDVKISDMMSPGYLLTGIGANFKKGDWFEVNLSPVTAKMTFINNDSIATTQVVDPDGNGTGKGKYGNNITESVRSEFGAYAKISIKKEILENITLSTQADFFSDYLHNFGAIDVNWNLVLLMKVNKFITATITTNLIYDEDISIVLAKDNAGNAKRIGPAVQFKETIGVGLTYVY